MMNSLLSKFENVTIQNDKRISEIDKAYCEKQERLYKEAIQAMGQTLNLFTNIYESYTQYDRRNYDHYIDEYEDLRRINDRMKKFKGAFISNIVQHFQKVYNVTLQSSEINQKYDTNVTYQNIVDEIFEQLGGFNFQEKAIKEIKDKCRGTIYNDDKIVIKKGKLSITDYVWWSTNWKDKKEIGYSDSKVRPLFKALSHFETEATETLSYYSSIYDELYKGEGEYDIFSKYELGYNKVKTIKFYKNGKVDIEFMNTEQAQEFKDEYLTR